MVGKGKRIRPDEKKRWDKRAKVYFQPKAWCDESNGATYLSLIPRVRGFGEILPEVMIFHEELCLEGNTICTNGNISPNPPSGGSINYTLYRKL